MTLIALFLSMFASFCPEKCPKILNFFLSWNFFYCAKAFRKLYFGTIVWTAGRVFNRENIASAISKGLFLKYTCESGLIWGECRKWAVNKKLKLLLYALDCRWNAVCCYSNIRKFEVGDGNVVKNNIAKKAKSYLYRCLYFIWEHGLAGDAVCHWSYGGRVNANVMASVVFSADDCYSQWDLKSWLKYRQKFCVRSMTVMRMVICCYFHNNLLLH